MKFQMGSILQKSFTILLLFCHHLGEVGFLHSKKKSIPGDASRVHHNIWGSLVLFQHLKIMNRQLIKKTQGTSLTQQVKSRKGSRHEILKLIEISKGGGGPAWGDRGFLSPRFSDRHLEHCELVPLQQTSNLSRDQGFFCFIFFSEIIFAINITVPVRYGTAVFSYEIIQN